VGAQLGGARLPNVQNGLAEDLTSLQRYGGLGLCARRAVPSLHCADETLLPIGFGGVLKTKSHDETRRYNASFRKESQLAAAHARTRLGTPFGQASLLGLD
jgi:hypothetical protein